MTGASLREWLDNGKDARLESQRLLDSLKSKVDDIDDIPQHNKWWRANGGEIELLMLNDQESLKKYCASRKGMILKAPLSEQGDGQTALTH